MKYFSISTVESAYKNISERTNNKFWGILAITSSVDSIVIPQHVYSLDIDNVSNLLEKQFCLVENTKDYNRGTRWNVIFSNNWTEYISQKLLHFSPNIYDVLIWYFRREKFEDNITKQQLIAQFLTRTNISTEFAQKLFNFDDRNIDFSSVKYGEAELLGILNKYCNNTTTYSTITAEKTYVAANAGELSRAPFVQTLYAGQGAQECMILTQFDFYEYYGNILSKSHPSKNNSSSASRQIIYFGAPGTGKSHKVREIIGEETNQPNVFRTTFHPDTDYASFVGCYKPSMRPTTSAEKTLTGKDEEIAYSFVPQVFTDAYVYAYKHPAETTYLVLEEINRGNCAQIFGDLFQLLDRKDGVSEYKIKADNDLAKYLVAQLGEESEGIKDGKLCLPANLSILATMNTSDQSLFPMDSAFKRRWEWEYVPINYSADILSGSFDITIGEKVYSWVEFIQSVNKHIFDLTQSEDKQMGNFFIKHSVDESEFKSKVMFYLWYEVLRDETGNNKYFFRQNTPDGKDSTPFTFKDLYEKDAQETIQLFMAYLGVAPK